MTAPPIQLTHLGDGAFVADRRSIPACVEHFGQGEVLTMAVVEERSRKSHDHFFVQLGELFDTLPEHLAERYPNVEAFRHAALIYTGHCDTRTVVCATKAEAWRMAALARALAPESIAVPKGAVVTVYTAHSQSMRAMGKETFQRSKDDCLGWALNQIDSGQEDGGRQQRPPVAA